MGSCQYLAERGVQQLLADRLSDPERERRQELVEHLRACPACRQAAVEEDPTLVFSLLEPEPMGEEQLADIQSSVRTLRRSRAIDSSDRPRSRVGGTTALVAASLLFVIALLPLTGGRRLEEQSEPVRDLVTEQHSLAEPEWQRWIDDRTAPPMIEDLNRPDARVYQLTEEDLAVVMIVDETLDL